MISRYGWWGALVALALAGCGADDGARGDEAPAPPAEGARARIVFLGTSLTAGLGVDPEQAYPAAIQRKIDSAGLSFEAVNAGVSGETSAGARRRIDWLLRQPVSVLVIETGANDGLRGQDVDSTRATIRAIVRRVKTVLPGAKVLLAQMESPPNLGERYTTAFRAMFPAVAREEGITLVPFLLDGVAGVPSMNQGDGIHPNEAGAIIVADNVFRAVYPVLRR